MTQPGTIEKPASFDINAIIDAMGALVIAGKIPNQLHVDSDLWAQIMRNYSDYQVQFQQAWNEEFLGVIVYHKPELNASEFRFQLCDKNGALL